MWSPATVSTSGMSHTKDCGRSAVRSTWRRKALLACMRIINFETISLYACKRVQGVGVSFEWILRNHLITKLLIQNVTLSGRYVYFTGLVFELSELVIDMVHHIHMLVWGNMFLTMASLVICMQLRLLFYQLQHKIKSHRNYLRVLQLMNMWVSSWPYYYLPS